MGTGRKPTWTGQKLEKALDEIELRLSIGETLTAICKTKGMPDISTVLKMALDADHPFAERYARAREIQSEVWGDGIVDVTTVELPKGPAARDEVARRALEVDTKKWVMARRLPKRWSEKQQAQETTVHIKRLDGELLDAVTGGG